MEVTLFCDLSHIQSEAVQSSNSLPSTCCLDELLHVNALLLLLPVFSPCIIKYVMGSGHGFTYYKIQAQPCYTWIIL